MASGDIRLFSTTAADEAGVAAELAAAGAPPDRGRWLLFATTDYDMGRLARALARRDIAPALGAATGCAIGDQGFLRHGVTGLYLPDERFVVADALIEDAAHFGLPAARALASSLREQLRRAGPAAPEALFGVVLVDAEARCEERLIAALGMEFAGLPLVGGSAGDVYFNPAGHPPGSTRLLYKGRALRNAAIFCLVAGDARVMAVSHHHFTVGERKIVITAADPERRIVREINGRPALREYAAACGLRRRSTALADYAPYPLMIRIGGQYFARGVQRVHPDGSMEFACAMEAGVVAAIAAPGDMLSRLEGLLAEIQRSIGAPQLVIGFDCAARTVVMEQDGLTGAVAELFRRHRVVGFSTLGEQFNTVHVNNSFTALAIAAGS
jgi:hypothetical protein